MQSLTSLGAQLKTSLMSGLGLGPAQDDSSDDQRGGFLTQCEQRLIVPARDETEEEAARAIHQGRGQFLARQDRWDEFTQEVKQADADRAKTSGGMAVADLLTFGARADVVNAAEDAICDGADPDIQGISALENLLAEFPNEYPVALVAATAHIDCGWAWRGDAWRDELPEERQKLFKSHFARAGEILDGYCGLELDAPSVAGARCALLAAEDSPRDRVADDYEDYIDLDPRNPRPMRAMGNNLLPRWFGSYQMLEIEARRTAARTGDIWGAGAYTWVYMDALAVDPQAADNLDVDFFIDGLSDILQRNPDQHVANELAAYCALTMAPENKTHYQSQSARLACAEIHACFDWIVRQTLYELHPLIWAEAAVGPGLKTPLPSRDALWKRGQKAARSAIASHFADELESGTTVTFSSHGMRLYPAM